MKQILEWLIFSVSMFMIGAVNSPTVQASTSNQKSPLAINVTALVRWNTDWPLVDEMKRAEVVTQCDASDNCWNTHEHHKVDWDDNGWPRTLTPQGGGRFTKVSYLLFGGAYERWDVPPPPTGNFHVLYEGEGKLEYSHAASYIESCGTGCDLVKIETPEDANDFIARISITATTHGNHLRNIRVIWPGGLCNGDVFTYYASADRCTGTYKSFVELKDQIIFHPDYLNDLKQYKAIRFMNFQRSNETTEAGNVGQQTRWTERRLPSYSVWSDSIPVNAGSPFPKKGVPIEVMVELLNALGTDGWFSIPFTANDEYVRAFARLVKQTLTKGQKIYLEYGNEAWNTAWPFSLGANWLQAKGTQFWPNTGTDFDRRLNWFAKRTTEVCKLWKTEWDGEADRVECVMGGWAAVKDVTDKRILNCFLWKDDARNPDKGDTCGSQVDAVAIAPYFGAYIGDLNYRDQIKNWDVGRLFKEINTGGQLSGAAEVFGIPASPSRYPGVNSDEQPEQNQIPVQDLVSVQDELQPQAQMSTGAASGGALAEAKGWMADHKLLAQKYGIDLLAYEGGQHLVSINYPSSSDPEEKVINDNIIQLFRNANRDNRMGAAYRQHLDDWRQAGGTLLALFDAVGPSSQSGSWGVKEYQNQLNPPKQAAVQQFINDNPCWWPECDGGGVVSYVLEDKQWRQLGLPRALPTGENTVDKVFGDDLGRSTYNSDWVVYYYDSANGGYVNPGLTGELQQGVGYWIMQQSGADVTLSLPSGSKVTPVKISTQCVSHKGCFEIPLVTLEGQIGWNMLAHVFESEVPLDQLRIVTSPGTFCAAGCNLETANTAGIVHDRFWSYDGTGYEQLGGADPVKPWFGFWIATLDKAYNLEPKLLIPAP